MNSYNGGYSTADILDKVRTTLATSNYGWTDYSESYSTPTPKLKVKKGDVFFDRKKYKHWVALEDFTNYAYTCKMANTMDRTETLYMTDHAISELELVI